MGTRSTRSRGNVIKDYTWKEAEDGWEKRDRPKLTRKILNNLWIVNYVSKSR